MLAAMNDHPSSTHSLSGGTRVPADAVSRRAYELWEQEGRPEGSDLRHWLQAEQELNGPRTEDAYSAPGTSTDIPRVAPQNGTPAAAPATDTQPLQGTRAAAAATREPKRASVPPMGAGSRRK